MLPVQQKLFMITSTIIEDNFKHQIVVVSNKTKKKKKRLSKYYLHLNIFLQILTSSVKLLIGKWQEKKTIFLIIHKKIDEKVTFFITFLKFYMLLEKTVSGKFRVGCKYFCCCCCCQYLFVINVDLSLLIALIMSAIKRRVMKKKNRTGNVYRRCNKSFTVTPNIVLKNTMNCQISVKWEKWKKVIQYENIDSQIFLFLLKPNVTYFNKKNCHPKQTFLVRQIQIWLKK